MPKDDHFAILLAINDYPGLSNLRGPENDADDFEEWLLDEQGGDLDKKNVKKIRSSDYDVVSDPDDANPTETHFKRALNDWLKRDGDWQERVGERLYLFFAGHGFTAGSIPDPALFTAQAQLGDTAHIAAYRYALKIQNAGFFDEIVLLVDSCQDVLKASSVNEPTWSPPDRRSSSRVKLMQAYGAPRGKKAYEGGNTGKVHGFFSSVLLEALRTAPCDSSGNVSARAVERTFFYIWGERYQKQVGYEPPMHAPHDMILYRRSVSSVSKSSQNINSQERAISSTAVDDALFSLTSDSVRVNDVTIQNAPRSAQRLINVTCWSLDVGARIRVYDSRLNEVASDVRLFQVKLAPGEYTVRFSLGDAVEERSLSINAEDDFIDVRQDFLRFSTPIPLRNTTTENNYHSELSLKLSREAALSSAQIRTQGMLLVFARDTSHSLGSGWSMSVEAREGIRLRKVGRGTEDPQVVECRPTVDVEGGCTYCLFQDLAPGIYLVGARHIQSDCWLWREITVAVSSSRWRTEVYLDCIENEISGRRFDVESAGVLMIQAHLPRDEAFARRSEVARLALVEGRAGIGRFLYERSSPPEPMLSLYAAYALTMSRPFDLEKNTIREICYELEDSEVLIPDIGVLIRWLRKNEIGNPIGSYSGLDTPVIQHGWDLAKEVDQYLFDDSQQYHVGANRVRGSIWTQIQVTEGDSLQGFSSLEAELLRSRMLDHMTLTQAVRLLGPSKPTLSPMQQALRRAIIDEAVSDEARTVRAIIWSIARESGLNEKVLFTCLGAMLIPKDRNTNQT